MRRARIIACVMAALAGEVLAAPGTDPLATPPPVIDISPIAPGTRAREPRGNPLWAIPLSTLTATRERPLFTISRRPPAPPAVAAPVRTEAPPPQPAEPDRPRLALVGAIAGGAQSIAVFLDQTTNEIVRLKMGENHGGWVLRAVKGREAVLEKNSESVTISLPAPNEVTTPAAPKEL